MLAIRVIVIGLTLISAAIDETSASFRANALRPWRRRPADDEEIPLPINPEAFMSTPEMIAHRGYPVETHSVVTEDGYILELHRIPYSLRTNNRYVHRPKKVVFMQHGLMATDSLFLLSPTDKCLAYLLADRGYDVWMGNARGNRYSRNHVHLDPDSAEFWDFSLDEVGYYDIPSSIDYVLRVTGQKKLVFVGYSMGAAVFFIAMIRHPEFNSKIDRMFALAPTTSRKYTQSSMRYMVPYFPQIQRYIQRRTKGAFFKNGLPRRILESRCEQNYRQAARCRDFLLGPSGKNPDNFDLNLIPVFNRHFPMGTSVKSLAQLVQNYDTGVPSFNSFDHGPETNFLLYGTPTPLAYNLSRVTAPVYIFWSENDLIATPLDVAWLASNLGNLQGYYRLADPFFSHFDFMMGSNIDTVLVNPILSLMPHP